MIKRFNLFLLVTMFFINWCFADIPTENLGEESMIKSLRAAIDSNSKLRSTNIVIGTGVN